MKARILMIRSQTINMKRGTYKRGDHFSIPDWPDSSKIWLVNLVAGASASDLCALQRQ
jgi:hypothetical protein